MNYVIAAWAGCGAILLAYAARTVRRERALRRLVGRGRDDR
jgi:hypothetical protein